MRAVSALPSLAVRWPRPTIRARLAAVYGGLILATGFALLTVVYLLLKRNIDAKRGSGVVIKPGNGVGQGDAKVSALVKALGVTAEQAHGVADETRYDTLHHLLVVSAMTLAGFTVLAFVLGWWLAGRALAPVHRITAAARDLSWRSLDERIRLRGPDDELKELADTFDAMLARLENAFESQRRFIANASHELRTPLGIQRAAIQLGLADPSPSELDEVRRHLMDANRRSERIIDGLLTLAQSDSGLEERRPVSLGEVVREAVAEQAATTAAASVRLRVRVREAVVPGDRVLLGQLVANLLRNAVQYNHAGGSVEVEVREDGEIVVANTGPEVPADRVDALFEPFMRLRQRSVRAGGDQSGAGLGLSIVRSIARVHDGDAVARPRPGGGLEVRVRLQATAPATR
jgi:signal transduction histidine kinase